MKEAIAIAPSNGVPGPKNMHIQIVPICETPGCLTDPIKSDIKSLNFNGGSIVSVGKLCKYSNSCIY